MLETSENAVRIFVDVCSKMNPNVWFSVNTLEDFYIPSFGLNNEILNEQPKELTQYFGGGIGLRIWQYPSQFARYLTFIAGYGDRITSYLEIGSRYGGTCLVQSEMLRSVSKSFQHCVAVDIMDEPPLISAYRNNHFSQFEYWQLNTQEESFVKRIENMFFDLVFIDGDHSYEAVKSDALNLIDCSNIQVFHDIKNDAVPGVGKFWSEYKQLFAGSHEFHEFLDQYESVEGNFLGIGVAVRRKWKRKSKFGKKLFRIF